MLIREWQLGDVDIVLKLINELDQFLGIGQGMTKEGLEKNFHRMRGSPEFYSCQVCEHDGVIVGVASVIYSCCLLQKSPSAFISILIVTEKYRGRGIGTALIQHILQEAQKKGLESVDVGVMKENTAAQKFYKKNGLTDEYLLLCCEFEPKN